VLAWCDVSKNSAAIAVNRGCTGASGTVRAIQNMRACRNRGEVFAAVVVWRDVNENSAAIAIV
jgi:hypothetical protein